MGLFIAEEVVRAFDLGMRDGDALLLVQLGHQRRHILGRRNPIRRAVDDQPGRRAGREKTEIIKIGGRGDRHEPGDVRPPHQQLHADPGAEAETGHPAVPGILVHGLQVVQRRRGIAELADPLVIFALASPDTAEIEPQHRETQIVEGIMQVVDDLVVHRPAKLRVRVQDDGDRGVAVRLRVVAAFKTTVRAGKYHFGHPGTFCTYTRVQTPGFHC